MSKSNFTFIQQLHKRWENIEKEVKKNALKSFKKTFKEIDFNSDVIDKFPKKTLGVYLFKISLNPTFSIDDFKVKWAESKKTGLIIHTSNIIVGRCLIQKQDEWYPLYLGKAEDLYGRISHHCFKESATYSLKLKFRKELLNNAKFGYGYYSIAEQINKNKYRIDGHDVVDKYGIQFVMENLERILRNDLGPWVGKQ